MCFVEIYHHRVIWTIFLLSFDTRKVKSTTARKWKDPHAKRHRAEPPPNQRGSDTVPKIIRTREGRVWWGEIPTRSGLSVEGGRVGGEIPGWHTVVGRCRMMFAARWFVIAHLEPPSSRKRSKTGKKGLFGPQNTLLVLHVIELYSIVLYGIACYFIVLHGTA